MKSLNKHLWAIVQHIFIIIMHTESHQRDGMKFRPYNQAQTRFVNLNYREILGEDSDAVVINDIIESMDLSHIESKYVEVGNLAYGLGAKLFIV
jgi:hypothetical protein